MLAALSGEVASFPYATSECDGKGSTHENNDLRYHSPDNTGRGGGDLKTNFNLLHTF